MAEAYIYDHVRTPRGIGRPKGGLHSVTSVELLSKALAALKDRNSFDTSLVGDVVAGCGSPVNEQGSAIGRIAVLKAGYDSAVPGQQVHRFCASGLEAVSIAASKVMAGMSDLTIGCGVESMSRIPMGSSGGAWYADPAVAHETFYIPQGISADLIATLYGFSREDLDAYACESQRRAHVAQTEGYFDGSIIPVLDDIGGILLDKDEHLRPGTTVEDLAGLPAAFEKVGATGFDDVALMKFPQLAKVKHVHTAGNSSGIVDGAGAVLIGSEKFGVDNGLKPRAKIRAFGSVGTDPTIMLTGPTPSAQRVLKSADMEVGDIDLFELNEAFAAVVLLFMEQMNIPHENINVNGGAIAMGHPIGATGAMIVGTALDELERRGLGTSLINLCVGAGMGTAMIIERV